MENQPWIRLHGSVGLLVPDSILPTGDKHQGGYTITGRQRQASSRSYVNNQPTSQPLTVPHSVAALSILFWWVG